MDNQVTKFFNAGNELPEKSNSLWLIKSGVVKSYTVDRQNKTAILGFWGKEDVAGKSLSKIEPYFLQCLTDVRAISIPASNWEVISNNLLNRIKHTQELSYIVRNPQNSDRLWLLLRWLVDKFGKDIPEGKIIDFELTIRDLADVLGMERIVIGELLERFQREELILRSPDGKIILKQE